MSLGRGAVLVAVLGGLVMATASRAADPGSAAGSQPRQATPDGDGGSARPPAPASGNPGAGEARPGGDGGAAPDGGSTVDAGAVAAASPSLARVVDRRPYVMLGEGVRRRDGGELYVISLFVDEVAARRAFPALASRAGGRSRDKLLGGDKSPPFVVWGDFDKLAEVRLLRDATPAEVRGIFEEGLAAQISDRAPSELRERALLLLAAFDRGLARGDLLTLHTTAAGQVEVWQGEAHRVIATDARLARALWEIWLGPRSVQPDLRRALLDRVDLLGR